MANEKKSACGYCVSHSVTNNQSYPHVAKLIQSKSSERQRRKRQQERREAGAAGRGAPIYLEGAIDEANKQAEELKADHDATK